MKDGETDYSVMDNDDEVFNFHIVKTTKRVKRKVADSVVVAKFDKEQLAIDYCQIYNGDTNKEDQ